jgi:hypothetical protein
MSVGLLAALVIAAVIPPSGRPPIGPLERYDPKLYDMTFSVTVLTELTPIATDRRHYALENAPIVLPVILQGAYSKVRQETIRGRLWTGSSEVAGAGGNAELNSGFPHHTYLYSMFVPRFYGTDLRWEVMYRTQSWSSRLDEQRAAELTWPQQWPDEVQDALKPSQFIESDQPIFANSVQDLTKGNLRLAPPYLAAKEIVRYTISRFQVSGIGTDFAPGGIIRGLHVKGAAAAWQNGLGSEHDLVCTCVAMLRAAGIPARPVIGVEESANNRGRDVETFVSWAEFYLEGAGWIPFDPDQLRFKTINNRDLREPWPEFGTMKDLNERIALSYFFIPAATVEAPWKPCVWGWDPRPGGDPGTHPAVNVSMVSRGTGEEDPR